MLPKPHYEYQALNRYFTCSHSFACGSHIFIKYRAPSDHYWECKTDSGIVSDLMGLIQIRSDLFFFFFNAALSGHMTHYVFVDQRKNFTLTYVAHIWVLKIPHKIKVKLLLAWPCFVNFSDYICLIGKTALGYDQLLPFKLHPSCYDLLLSLKWHIFEQ